MEKEIPPVEKVNRGLVICPSSIWVPKGGLKNDDTSPLDCSLKRDHFSEREKARHFGLTVREKNDAVYLKGVGNIGGVEVRI